ncbi:hypothetical protein AHAS_Ahas14G0149900 [Arachis hypogaea]
MVPSRHASSSRRPCCASSLVFCSSLVFRRASAPLSLAASHLRASMPPCFHASLASPPCPSVPRTWFRCLKPAPVALILDRAQD